MGLQRGGKYLTYSSIYRINHFVQWSNVEQARDGRETEKLCWSDTDYDNLILCQFPNDAGNWCWGRMGGHSSAPSALSTLAIINFISNCLNVFCLLPSLYPQYLIVVLLEEILPANFCTMFCTCCDNPGRRGLYLIPIIICSAVVVLLLTASSSQITARF